MKTEKEIRDENCPTCGRSMGKNIEITRLKDNSITIKAKKLQVEWRGHNIIVWSELDDK